MLSTEICKQDFALDFGFNLSDHNYLATIDAKTTKHSISDDLLDMQTRHSFEPTQKQQQS